MPRAFSTASQSDKEDDEGEAASASADETAGEADSESDGELGGEVGKERMIMSIGPEEDIDYDFLEPRSLVPSAEWVQDVALTSIHVELSKATGYYVYEAEKDPAEFGSVGLVKSVEGGEDKRKVYIITFVEKEPGITMANEYEGNVLAMAYSWLIDDDGELTLYTPGDEENEVMHVTDLSMLRAHGERVAPLLDYDEDVDDVDLYVKWPDLGIKDGQLPRLDKYPFYEGEKVQEIDYPDDIAYELRYQLKDVIAELKNERVRLGPRAMARVRKAYHRRTTPNILARVAQHVAQERLATLKKKAAEGAKMSRAEEVELQTLLKTATGQLSPGHEQRRRRLAKEATIDEDFLSQPYQKRPGPPQQKDLERTAPVIFDGDEELVYSAGFPTLGSTSKYGFRRRIDYRNFNIKAYLDQIPNLTPAARKLYERNIRHLRKQARLNELPAKPVAPPLPAHLNPKAPEARSYAGEWIDEHDTFAFDSRHSSHPKMPDFNDLYEPQHVRDRSGRFRGGLEESMSSAELEQFIEEIIEREKKLFNQQRRKEHAEYLERLREKAMAKKKKKKSGGLSGDDIAFNLDDYDEEDASSSSSDVDLAYYSSSDEAIASSGADSGSDSPAAAHDPLFDEEWEQAPAIGDEYWRRQVAPNRFVRGPVDDPVSDDEWDSASDDEQASGDYDDGLAYDSDGELVLDSDGEPMLREDSDDERLNPKLFHPDGRPRRNHTAPWDEGRRDNLFASDSDADRAVDGDDGEDMLGGDVDVPGFNDSDSHMHESNSYKWAENLMQPDIPDVPASFSQRLLLADTLEARVSQGELYTGERRIARHSASEGHVGMFFEAERDVLSAMPPRLHACMAEEFERAGPFMMIREPGLQIVEALNGVQERVSAGFDQAAPDGGRRFAVTGPRGCGKSAALHYVTQHALQNDWLVLPAHADEFTTETLGLITRSEEEEGVFLQGRYSKHYLTQLARSRPEQLRKIALKLEASRSLLKDNAVQAAVAARDEAQREQERKERLARAKKPGESDVKKEHMREENETDDPDKIAATERLNQLGQVVGELPRDVTLHDLVTCGLTDENAPAVMRTVMQELSQPTEVPVLVMIDGVNAWDQRSDFVDPDRVFRRLPARRLQLVNEFERFETLAPPNGVSVFSTTSVYTPKFVDKHLDKADEVVVCRPYRMDELRRCIDHYRVSHFYHSGFDESLVARVQALTGGTPRDVHQTATLL